jgi:hypothetical protein
VGVRRGRAQSQNAGPATFFVRRQPPVRAAVAVNSALNSPHRPNTVGWVSEGLKVHCSAIELGGRCENVGFAIEGCQFTVLGSIDATLTPLRSAHSTVLRSTRHKSRALCLVRAENQSFETGPSRWLKVVRDPDTYSRGPLHRLATEGLPWHACRNGTAAAAAPRTQSQLVSRAWCAANSAWPARGWSGPLPGGPRPHEGRLIRLGGSGAIGVPPSLPRT